MLRLRAAIGIIGESCTGKSTLANKLKSLLNAEVYTGNDYLRYRRMRGNLPAPVAAMLENRHGCFDAEICDIHMVSDRDDLDEVCISIRNRVNSQ